MQKQIKVRGHYKLVQIGTRIVADPVAQQEAEVPIYKKVWIEPYTKVAQLDNKNSS